MPYKAIRMSAVASLLLAVVAPLGPPPASSDTGRAMYQGRQMAFSVDDDTRCLDLGSLALALR
jgi:hypothetical protein